MIPHNLGAHLLQHTLVAFEALALITAAARQLGAHDPRRRLRAAGKMLMFAAVHPRAALRWLRYLDHPLLRALVLEQPLLLDKPRRLYLNNLWSPAERVQALMTHYQWTTRHLRADTVAALYADRPLRLCDVGQHDGVPKASLWLARARFQMREGELALLLCSDGEGRAGGVPPVLATLSFSIVSEAGRQGLSIGCVQGPKDAGLSDFKALTKAMHGLRPKALLVWAAQRFAAQWALDVRGISPSAHPLTEGRYRRLSPLKQAASISIQAGYGVLWRESGGAAANRQGWVQLPATPVIKSRSEVETSKRALYERRGTLLGELDLQLGVSLQAIGNIDAPGPMALRTALA